MSTVGAGFAMSLDGFIAGLDDSVDRLFQWYFTGDKDLKLPMGDQEMEFKLSSESAEVFIGEVQATGAIVSGRRMFDVAGAWGGRHPMDVPIFVVTHRVPEEWVKDDSPFTFVTGGVERAVELARKAAGNKNIGVGGADVARQCLKAGLLDEIHIDLVPVLLGKGVRFFEYLGIEPVELVTTEVVNAPGVIHLTFRIVK